MARTEAVGTRGRGRGLLSDEDICARYVRGEPLVDLVLRAKLSHDCIKRILRAGGVTLRSRREAQRLGAERRLSFTRGLASRAAGPPFAGPNGAAVGQGDGIKS